MFGTGHDILKPKAAKQSPARTSTHLNWFVQMVSFRRLT